MNSATAELEPAQVIDLIDCQLRQGMGTNGSHAVSLSSWTQTAANTREAAPTVENKALTRLLAIADSYLNSGELHQALEMYFDLMQTYPSSTEAKQSEDRILDVARQHERAGELRQARAIYQRLT